MRIRPALWAQAETQPPRWASCRYQPRPSISKVRASRGQVSTRNAGTMASPVDVSPTRPSRPGRTHHQGRGSSPLSTARKGFSTCSNLSILLLHAAGHDRHVSREGLDYSFDPLTQAGEHKQSQVECMIPAVKRFIEIFVTSAAIQVRSKTTRFLVPITTNIDPTQWGLIERRHPASLNLIGNFGNGSTLSNEEVCRLEFRA